MSSIGCKLGWHDWNKYGDIVKAYSGLTQFKSCKRCNIIKYTGIYGNQAPSDSVNDTVKEAAKGVE